MARIRSVKPEFFDDEDIAQLPALYRLAFMGLWCQADREGRLQDRPARLKVQVLPYDDVDMDAVLTALAEARFITRYEAGGKRLIQVRQFRKHQVINQREAQSTLPGPPIGTHVHAHADTCAHVGKGKEGKGKEGKESTSRDSDESAMLARFQRFWRAYPRHDAQAEALQQFKKLNPDDVMTQRLIDAVNEQRTWPQWQDPTFVPQAVRWLRRSRWTDEPPSGMVSRPPPDDAGAPLWERIATRLRAVVNGHAFAMWIKPIRDADDLGDVLVLRVPSATFGATVQMQFGERIAAILRELGRGETVLRLVETEAKAS